MKQREIKFRAWDKKRQRIITNVGFENGDTGRRILCERGMIPPNEGDEYFNDYQYGFRTDEIELMQFTGLKDKNGVKIYEGDIIKNGAEEIIEVKFGDWNCGDCSYVYGYDIGGSKNDLEIIGNIWENPKLII